MAMRRMNQITIGVEDKDDDTHSPATHESVPSVRLRKLKPLTPSFQGGVVSEAFYDTLQKPNKTSRRGHHRQAWALEEASS